MKNNSAPYDQANVAQSMGQDWVMMSQSPWLVPPNAPGKKAESSYDQAVVGESMGQDWVMMDQNPFKKGAGKSASSNYSKDPSMESPFTQSTVGLSMGQAGFGLDGRMWDKDVNSKNLESGFGENVPFLQKLKDFGNAHPGIAAFVNPAGALVNSVRDKKNANGTANQAPAAIDPNTGQPINDASKTGDVYVPPATTSSNTGLIIGGIVGLVVLILIIILVIYMRKNKGEGKKD